MAAVDDLGFALDFTNVNIHNEEKKKKAPGRPRKNPQKAPDPKIGIVDEPTVEDAMFELFYCNPIALGKALGFYLSLSDMPLHCKFTPNAISHLALDRHKKSKIAIIGNPSKFNHYYCKSNSVIQFGISNQYLELLAKTIDSDMSTVKWYSIEGKNDETYMDFFTPEYKVTSQETLICCGKYQQIDDEGFDDNDYQIKFQMKARKFKRLLAKAKSYGDQLTIRQAGADYPLTFIYSNANGHAKSEQVYEGKEEMCFESTMKQGEIFNISVQVKYWYPVANSAMLDSIVHISLHKEKPIMTKIILDEGALSIKVLTAINDIRQESDITTTITTSRTRDSTTHTPKSSARAEIYIPDLKFTPYEFDLPSSPGFKLNSPHSTRSTRSQPRSPRVITPLNERQARGNSDLPE
jgi:hypothetical protein